MGLEAGSFINDLVVTNPIGGTDPRSQGDDHLRLIKTVLKNSFPGTIGAYSFLDSSDGALPGPTFKTSRRSPTPAANDFIGAYTFYGNDSALAERYYAGILPQIVDPTAASIDGRIVFQVVSNNVDINAGIIDGTGFQGAIGATTPSTGNFTTLTMSGVLTAGGLDVGTGEQTNALIKARGSTGNAIEFGHGNPAGFGSTIGHYSNSGNPFIAFNGEHGTNINTIRTRGQRAAILRGDSLGGFVFENVANANADNQVPVVQLSMNADGDIVSDGNFTTTHTIFSGTFRGAANTAPAPTYSWTGDPDTGIFNSAPNEIGFSAGAAIRAYVDVNGLNTGTLGLTGGGGIIQWRDDTDTWIRRLAENVIQFVTGGVQRGVFDTSGLDVNGQMRTSGSYAFSSDTDTFIYNIAANEIGFAVGNVFKANITASGINVGKTLQNAATVGASLGVDGQCIATVAGDTVFILNRISPEGTIVQFRSDNLTEGTIAEAGGTVTYNAFLGSHWSQLLDGSKPEILRGTVCEAIDELCEWPEETNDRLPKFKISDTVGSKNVYGVFLGWDNDDERTNDAYIAAIGAGWVRIASGVIVHKGDYLESNGDGCAKVQDDDVFLSKTIGKVTSTQIIETYDDGSYLVPCTLHCG